MKIERGRKITLTYREKGASGRATLVIDVSADEGELPHEHRDDLKEVAAELLGVPLSALPEGVDIELKRTGGDHAHPHPHPALPSDGAAAPDKVKA